MEEAADDDQVLIEVFDEWARERAEPDENDTEDESETDQADTTADETDSTTEDAVSTEFAQGSHSQTAYVEPRTMANHKGEMRGLK